MTYPFLQAANYTRAAIRTIDLLVTHDMEAPEKGDTAESVARYFHNQPRGTSGSSAHYCIDSDSIVQCVWDQDVAWHAPFANHNGLGFEHAGYARQSAHEWDDEFSRGMLVISAKLYATKCKQYKIPAVWLHAADLAAGRRGITSHWEVTKAFSHGVGHTDPGPNFPKDHFVAMVRQNLGETAEGPALKKPEPTLSRGDRGWRVKQVQRLLNFEPSGKDIAADGVFGAGTEGQVKIFQRSWGLRADGVVGPSTWHALWSARYRGGGK